MYATKGVFEMAFFMGSTDEMLMGLIKELKASHKRIAQLEAQIARERQIIAATIKAHQARGVRHAPASKVVEQARSVSVTPETDSLVRVLNT